MGTGIARVGVLGAGTMGHALALVHALGGLEVRLIKPTKVLSFYLPVLMGKAGSGRAKPAVGISGLGLRKRMKSAATEAAKGAAESVGLETDEGGEIEMPTSKEPLRLLLSSWTYPEPRTDLAMREGT